jgi:predicted acyl esterase
MTDPLFPATEALQMYAKLRTVDPAYPIKLFLGDVGHDYSGERKDEWDLAHTAMNAFLDHYLRPDRTTTPPRFDVTATITRCLEQNARLGKVSAPTWRDISGATMTFTGVGGGVTTSTPPGQSGLATDPISTATLPLPGAYKGCRRMRPARPDPGAVTFDFPMHRDLTLLGGPVVRISYVTTAPDVELNVRLWDVAPDGSVQGLITRGTFRSLDGPGTELEARFQLAPQGYRFPKGHTIRVEVAANDAPYFQTSNVPAVAQIEALSLTVPLSRSPAGR